MGELRDTVATLLRATSQLKDILVQDANIRFQAAHPNPLNRFGRKGFSQSDEDGITLELVRRLNLSCGTFAEFGVGNGLENNTIILGGLGWRGFWVGGQELVFDPTPLPRLTYIRDWITRDNVLRHAEAGMAAIGTGAVDLISLDLDGNDIYIAEALLNGGILPKIFIAEYNAKFLPPVKFQIAYNPDHRWGGDDYFGAALQNFVDLFSGFGYALVCCNAYSGANAFFVRKDFSDRFPEVPADIRDIHVPPRYHLYSAYGHKASPRVVETLFS
ncbi:hypothetical protein [Nitrospirillum viridazoti]|uniref:Methyltransferase FkbM-like protein n=1 Tax=Nitrospirillum amazonense TaxID=28077 RepID=A0A560I025_9PROT|nr:hypothetical protein [Nitrospirillum amazonense]TWB51521.1 hypothetical protein FBZ92_120115 [Nitrospirillum amazonense]